MDTTYHWQGNYCGFAVPGEAVEAIAQQGRNDDAVAYWLPRIDLDHIDIESVRAEVDNHDVYPQSDEAYLEYLVWLAAWDIMETPDLYTADA